MPHCRPARTDSINLSEVAGALHSSKGITLNLYKPFRLTKAAFALS